MAITYRPAADHTTSLDADAVRATYRRLGGKGMLASTGARRAGSPAVEQCRVTDGDTIRCGQKRIRLLGIDAPELPGHCRPSRLCVEGNPYASRASLAAAVAPTMDIDRVGRDRYGRTLATVAGRHGDLSCWQLSRRQAIYKPLWDDGDRVSRMCPNLAHVEG
jgi:endonuclease YncB( thermonuclease family)